MPDCSHPAIAKDRARKAVVRLFGGQPVVNDPQPSLWPEPLLASEFFVLVDAIPEPGDLVEPRAEQTRISRAWRFLRPRRDDTWQKPRVVGVLRPLNGASDIEPI